VDAADDAGKAQILEEEGLSDYTVEDLTEAVTFGVRWVFRTGGAMPLGSCSATLHASL